MVKDISSHLQLLHSRAMHYISVWRAKRVSYIRLNFAKMSRRGDRAISAKKRRKKLSSARCSVSKFRCIPDRMKLTCHRVTFRENLNAGCSARSDKAKCRSGEHQDDARAPPPSTRTLVESKRNKRATRATRARMQNNAPRRARPSRR